LPEQQFSTEDEPAEGVSAVAAIAKAQEQGQRVFHITQDNLDEALAEISISAESRDDIRRGVLQFGYEAIVHESPITVPGWRGSGYILTNPETGAGSYMIDGGKNGSFFLGLLVGSMLMLAVALALIFAGPGIAAASMLGAALVAQFGIKLGAIGLVIVGSLLDGELDVECFVLGLLTPLIVLFLVAPMSSQVIGVIARALGIVSFTAGFTPFPSPYQCLSG
jgi:hypothetical protein